MITSPGDLAKLERCRRLREAHPLGSVEVVQVGLLIACRYKLSRPIKDQKVLTAFVG
jgi:hypothetical protein